MIGVIVNAVSVIVGSLIGVIFNEKISKKITDAILVAVGLCVISIGINGFIKDCNTIVMIVSVVLGTAVGTLIDLDNLLNMLGDWVQSKFKNENGNSTIAEAFVTSTLLFCVGSLAVVGSFNAGLSNDNSMLFTKSLLDLISSMMLAASLGFGVSFASVSIIIYQGLLVLLAKFLEPILTTNMITQLNCVGSLLILAIGLNLTGITKLKVSNLLPAILFVPFVLYLYGLVF